LDWDGNGTIDSTLATVNLNDLQGLNNLEGCDGGTSNEPLSGFDDWEHLENTDYINRNTVFFIEGLSVELHRDFLNTRINLLEKKMMDLESPDFKADSEGEIADAVKKYYLNQLQSAKLLVSFNQVGVAQNLLNQMKTTLNHPVGGNILQGKINPSNQILVNDKIDTIISSPQITTSDIDDLSNIVKNIPNGAFEKISQMNQQISNSEPDAKKNYKILLDRAKKLVSVGQEDAANLQLFQLNENLLKDLNTNSYNSKISKEINSIHSSLEISTEFVPTNIHTEGNLQNSIFIKGERLCWESTTCFEPYVNWLPIDPDGMELTFFNNDNKLHSITITNPNVGNNTHFKILEIPSGKSGVVFFTQPGTYEYYSSVDDRMRGFVIVDPHAVPEFGIIAMAILFVAMGSIIVISWNKNLKYLTKH